MKKIIITAAAVLFTASIFFSCGGGSSVSLKTTEDSLEYARATAQFSGVIDFIRNDSTIDSKLVKAAIDDMFAGKGKMNADTATKFLEEYYYVRKPIINRRESEEFLAKIESENNKVQKTESGLLYEILEPGDMNQVPGDNDAVKVVYEGKLKDGKVFDSSIERGDTVEFGVNQVIPGWSEGIKLIGKGGRIKLWIPSDLGYGEQGNMRNIEGNEALAFEVGLIDVIPEGTTDNE